MQLSVEYKYKTMSVCTIAVCEVMLTYCYFWVCRENNMDNFGRFVRSLDDSIRHLYYIGDANAKRHQDCKMMQILTCMQWIWIKIRPV